MSPKPRIFTKIGLMIQFFVVSSLILLSYGILYRGASESYTDVLKIALLSESQALEADYLRYLESQKEIILKRYKSDPVQKFSRPQLRKEFAFDNKEDLENHSLRTFIYSVENKDEGVEVREVYDTYQPKLLWDKILDLLSTEALNRTQETVKAEKSDKFAEMLTMVMKDSGLGKIREPGQFINMNLMGREMILYWDIIYKKCPDKIRKITNQENCVKGLFLTELELNSVNRDFFNTTAVAQLAPKREISLGLLKKEGDLRYVNGLYPPSAGQDLLVYLSSQEALEKKGTAYTLNQDFLALGSLSQVLFNTVIGIKTRINLPFWLNWPKVLPLLLLLSLALTFLPLLTSRISKS